MRAYSEPMHSIQEFMADTRKELYRHHKLIRANIRRLDEQARQILDMTPPLCTGTASVSFPGDTEYHNQQTMYGRQLEGGPNYPPSVFVNIATQGSMTKGWDARAILIGNIGFSIHVYRVGDTNGEAWNHIPITWIAASCECAQ
jgi:hypothetical protein